MEEAIPAALELAISPTPKAWLKGDVCGLRTRLRRRLQHLNFNFKRAFSEIELRVRKTFDAEPPPYGFDFRILSHRGGMLWV